MLIINEDKCEGCNGWGILWNDVFDRKLDQISDTQGLSFYEAANQIKGNPRYKDDYWKCEKCNGKGKK